VSSDVVRAKGDVRKAPRIWRDFGSTLPFQTRLTQTKPVLPLTNKHGSQVKDKGQRQCCHTKHKIFPYRPTRNVFLLSEHGNKKILCIVLCSVLCSILCSILSAVLIIVSAKK
jgi:hypothetical protein